MEVSWNPDDPAPGVRDLAAALGTAGPVFAAIDLCLLNPKRLELPPVAAAQKRELVRLDPTRFFAAGGDLAIAARDEDGLVFAVPEDRLAAWEQALAEIGPVERVEAGPAALVRALARSGIRDARVVRATPAGRQLLEIRDGRLATVRRPFGDAEPEIEETGGEGGGADRHVPPLLLEPWDEEIAAELRRRHRTVHVKPAPASLGFAPPYLTAVGAALEPERGLADTLATDELRGRQTRRRRLRLLAATAACAVALGMAGAAVDGRRDRALRELEARAAALAAPAEEARRLQSRAEELRAEILAIAAIEAERPRPLQGLLELTRTLPEEAWIESIRATPEGWQIDGYASDAAALVPVFEEDPRFEDVRSVAGTSPTRLNGVTYENFSLVLRRVRTP